MNVTNCTPNELAAAMMAYLVAGPGSTPPIRLKAGTWLSGRAETKTAFGEIFPGMMDKPRTKKKR